MLLSTVLWTLCGIQIVLVGAISTTEQSGTHALVYRGPAACHGCPEAVANLLLRTKYNFSVSYVGPQEKLGLTPATLANAAVYVQPGGGGLNENWRKHMKEHKQVVRNFVANGGKYLGFCLGEYMAGNSPGFDLLPAPDDTDEECIQPGAQVTNRSNTIIQVNWAFAQGSKKGTTEDGRWIFFQDGAVIKPWKNGTGRVLGRYTTNGDVAAVVVPFQKGAVGMVRPHPEADESWYKPYHLRNPDGINFDIGEDFIAAVMEDDYTP